MKKNNHYFIIIKNNLLTIIFTLFLISLIMFSQTNLHSAKSGLLLWAKNVVPSLFPFFIATELLNYTNLPYILGKLTNKFMKPLFNIPGEGSYAFIMGIISGYPVGAKIVNKFIEEKICTKQEAERMLAFTNNSGPLFIIGTIGISLFGYSKFGIILFITHILSCLTVGIIFGIISRNTNWYIYKLLFKTSNNNNNHYNRNDFAGSTYTISDLGTILSHSITNATSTIMLIGGFIVLFSIIISIFNELNVFTYISSIFNSTYMHRIGICINSEYIKCILIGLVELTNGVSAISCLHTKNISTQIIITAFILGFAGFSIFLQILSISAKNKLSMKPYFIGKVLQGLIASFYTFLIFHYFSFLNLNL